MAPRDGLRVQITLEPLEKAVRDARGRFQSSQKIATRVFTDMAQETARDAASILRRQTASGSERYHRRPLALRPLTGELAKLVESNGNWSADNSGFNFMRPNFLNSRSRYWRAIEQGTRKHVGRTLVVFPRAVYSLPPGVRVKDRYGRSASAGKGGVIRREVRPHHFAREAWLHTNMPKRAESIMRDLYPGMKFTRR